jgi:hypothetical protein
VCQRQLRDFGAQFYDIIRSAVEATAPGTLLKSLRAKALDRQLH